MFSVSQPELDKIVILLDRLFPKKTLDRITIGELENERIILNEKEQGLTKELEKEEKNKEILIQQGFKLKTQNEMLHQAERVRVVDDRVKALSSEVSSLFKEIRALNSLAMAKKALQKSKDRSLLRQICDQHSLGEIAQKISDMKVKLGIDDKKIEEFMNLLGTSSEETEVVDLELRSMMEMWEKGRESGTIEQEMNTLNSSKQEIIQEDAVL